MARIFKKNKVVGYVALGLLLALLGFTFLMGSRGGASRLRNAANPATPPTVVPAPIAPDRPVGSLTQGSPDLAPRPGEITAVVEDVVLSPQARLLAERFVCVCGCKDILATCTCDESPGSHDMKRYLQQLVDEGKSPAEVESAMVTRYGQAVIP